ncbi:MAG: VIT1/CCC1 transporter family protein [Gammaproteobacteria bacterium]|nr:VIT1/CCC1 transporter family protein [Gammaproteobacteria bacterium]
MAELKHEKRAPVLDPVERVSEIIFGLIMALSFTGTVSAATAGSEEIRTVMFAALGCNLAWGLVDGVMYLVSLMTERTRNITLLRRVRGAAAAPEAHAIIADAMPGRLGGIVSEKALEEIRLRITALPEPPARGRLGRDDFAGALGVFLIVVLSTFPVVLPFMLFAEVPLAMRVSNAVALVTLFACGFALGRYAGGIPWRSGFAMAAIGVVLVIATIALGG